MVIYSMVYHGVIELQICHSTVGVIHIRLDAYNQIGNQLLVTCISAKISISSVINISSDNHAKLSCRSINISTEQKKN